MPNLEEFRSRFRLWTNSVAGGLLGVLMLVQPCALAAVAGPAGVGAAYFERSAAEAQVGAKPTNYAYQVGDIRRYGALGNDTSDDTAALKSAIAVAISNGGRVSIPVGTYRFSSTLALTSYITLEGESAEKSILKKTGNIVGIELQGNGSAILSRFTLIGGDSADHATGILVSKGGRCRLSNLNVTAQGGNGIELRNSNLATLRDIRVTLNGGDGLAIRGTSGSPDTNAMTIEGIDTRGNLGWGLNIESGRANFIIGVAAQSNGSGGVRINDRSNLLAVYSESNRGNQIEITASANSAGNTVFVQEGSVVNNAPGNLNTVLQNRRHTVYDSSATKVTTDRLLIPSEQASGRVVVGSLSLSHDRDRIYDLVAGGSGSDQTLKLASAADGTRFVLSTDNLIVRHGTPDAGEGEVAFGTTAARTVGEAGQADPPPASPAGYLEVSVNGKRVKVPFYNP